MKRTRTYAKLLNSIWSSDFVELPADCQRLYMLLISQPETNAAGIVPLMPRRWARMAPDTSADDVRRCLAVLEARGYVVIDEDTEELLIRSFIANDEGHKTPNILTNIRQAVEQVHSRTVRHAAETAIAKALNKPLPEPLPEPIAQPMGHESIPITTTPTPCAEPHEGDLAEVVPIGPSEPAKAGTRRPDPLFGALVEACGWDYSSMTASERTSTGTAAAKLKGLAAGVSPEDVVARAEVYRRKFRDATITPHAVVKHWSQLVPPRRPVAAEMGGVRMSQGAASRC